MVLVKSLGNKSNRNNKLIYEVVLIEVMKE